MLAEVAADVKAALDQAKAELSGEPYKLELVDIKGDVEGGTSLHEALQALLRCLGARIGLADHVSRAP